MGWPESPCRFLHVMQFIQQVILVNNIYTIIVYNILPSKGQTGDTLFVELLRVRLQKLRQVMFQVVMFVEPLQTYMIAERAEDMIFGEY